MKHLSLALVLIVISCLLVHAQTPDPEGFNKMGFISNSKGENCWYKQIYERDGKHFLSPNLSLKNTHVRTMIFDDPHCMSSTVDGESHDVIDFNERINKKMIAHQIRRWWEGSYVIDSSSFDIEKLEVPGMFQHRGQCIQSREFPIHGIAIEYFIRENSITKVVYSPTAGGCGSSS